MYRGFNISLDKSIISNYETNLIAGNAMFKIKQIPVKESLDYATSNGIISGDKLKNGWFPEIKADIFISHSHADKDLAVALASFLERELGLTCFVDSCVWGYADNLLKKLNDQYSVLRKEADGTPIYNHIKANNACNHVNLILNSALTDMIDKTECLFFLNTQNSAPKSKDAIESTTFSPWIYTEINISSTIREKTPDRNLAHAGINKRAALDSYSESLTIKYPLSLNHLTTMNLKDIKMWEYYCSRTAASGVSALDKLYELHPIK